MLNQLNQCVLAFQIKDLCSFILGINYVSGIVITQFTIYKYCSLLLSIITICPEKIRYAKRDEAMFH